jgi:hypothetical protein
LVQRADWPDVARRTILLVHRCGGRFVVVLVWGLLSGFDGALVIPPPRLQRRAERHNGNIILMYILARS